MAKVFKNIQSLFRKLGKQWLDSLYNIHVYMYFLSYRMFYVKANEWSSCHHRITLTYSDIDLWCVLINIEITMYCKVCLFLFEKQMFCIWLLGTLGRFVWVRSHRNMSSYGPTCDSQSFVDAYTCWDIDNKHSTSCW